LRGLPAPAQSPLTKRRLITIVRTIDLEDAIAWQ